MWLPFGADRMIFMWNNIWRVLQMEAGGWDSLSTHHRLVRLNDVLLAVVILVCVTFFCVHVGQYYNRPKSPHTVWMTRGMTAMPAPRPNWPWGVSDFLGDRVTQPEMWGVNAPWCELQPRKTGHVKDPADQSLSQCFLVFYWVIPRKGAELWNCTQL